MTVPTPVSTEAPRGSPSYISASQAAALLRSGLAIAIELIGNAFDPIVKAITEEMALRWDLDVESQFVRRLLNDKSGHLKSLYLRYLREQQDQALAEVLSRNTSTQTALMLQAETMSLLDAVSLSSRTLVERHANRMRGVDEESWRDLHIIVGFLVGKTSLRTSDNPFSAAVFMQPLLSAAEDLELNQEARDYFLGVFEKPLAEEISRIYLLLIEHFGRHGLDAKGIRRDLAAKQAAARAAADAQARSAQAGDFGEFRPTVPGGFGDLGRSTIPGGVGGPNTIPLGGSFVGHSVAAVTGSTNTMQGARPAHNPQAAGARYSNVPRIDVPTAEPGFVLNGLLSRMQASSRDLPAGSFARSSPAEPVLLEAVNELQQLGLEGLAGATLAGSPSGTISAWREHLVEKSSRTVDKLTIEIVGLMFDHVLQDSQVPDEIKALISRLQFPVLKAALMDADFFASNGHPARRLIDRIATTSAGWEPYGDENERFRLEVERIVKEVLARFNKDVSVFEVLLGEFERFVTDIGPRDSDPVARAKRALEEAEKREILVINTTIQVRRAFEKVELDPYLRDFLVGPWVQVLVAAQMREDQTPGFSKRFREAIHDVVWSVQPKANTEDRRRLTAIIPNLIRVLRDGLALTRTSEHEQQVFLKQLMESHAMAVKPVDQATYIKASLVSSEVKAKIDGLQITGTHPITTVAGGIRVSTDAVMQAAEEFNAQVHMPEQITDVGDLDRVEEARMDEEIASWQRGAWFEYWDGTQTIKAKLRWISPLRTLFLFAANNEKNAHVLPPNVIKSYLKRGYLKPIETMSLTRRAVDQVVGDFERRPQFAQEMASRYTAPQ